jgi:23S rRNA (guanosine2251-2'-O)-methyltransferase
LHEGKNCWRGRAREPRHQASEEEPIVGVHAVSEALSGGEPITRILIGRGRQSDRSLAELRQFAERRRIPVVYKPESEFERFGHARHQHVAAFAPAFQYAPFVRVLEAARAAADSLIVALDHIEDPYNLGAILRNAEAAGAAAVILPERRSAGVTPAARRTAAGAASHVNVSRVPNLVRALEQLKAAGHWIVGATAAAGGTPYTEIDFSGKCTIVIGSEGKGLSQLTEERCDFIARIPLRGRVAALNAASAAAVLLFEALRQKAQPALVPSKNKPAERVNP